MKLHGLARIYLRGGAEGADWCQHMILVRANWSGRAVETHLIERKIPYIYIGGTALFKSAHVKDVLSALRIVANNEDELAWVRYLRLWPGRVPGSCARPPSVLTGRRKPSSFSAFVARQSAASRFERPFSVSKNCARLSNVQTFFGASRAGGAAFSAKKIQKQPVLFQRQRVLSRHQRLLCQKHRRFPTAKAFVSKAKGFASKATRCVSKAFHSVSKAKRFVSKAKRFASKAKAFVLKASSFVPKAKAFAFKSIAFWVKSNGF